MNIQEKARRNCHDFIVSRTSIEDQLNILSDVLASIVTVSDYPDFAQMRTRINFIRDQYHQIVEEVNNGGTPIIDYQEPS